MTEQEFFTKPNKKLLISDSFPHAESLIKRYVLLNNQPVVNIERETLESIANRLYKTYGDTHKTIIDNDASVFIVDYLIRFHCYSFVPKQCFSISTSQVFYDAIKEIKYGKIINPNNKRYLEILPLINDYNNYLKDNSLIDSADLVAQAIDLVSVSYLGYGDNLIFGVTNNLKGKLRYLEQQFLNKIVSSYKQDISYIDYTSPNSKTNCVKVNAHGFLNEVKYIVEDIRKNNLNFDTVNVFVSDSSYNITIKSLFDYYHIPYSFVMGESAADLSIISLFNNALGFVENLCDLQAIYNILISDAIKEEFKDLIPHLSNLKCDHVNIAEYHGTFSKQINDREKQFFDNLLLLDNENLSISDLFKLLVAFIQYASKEDCYAVIEEPINKIAENLTYINELSCPLLFQKIQIIRDFIQSIKIHENKNNPVVKIYTIGQALLIDRKFNYFIGLSASQLTLKETQSPVFNDGQLNDILSLEAYVHLCSNNNAELMDNVKCLLSTSNDGDYITYIYSSYDSVNFKQQAASTLYLDQQCKEEESDYELDKGSLTKPIEKQIVSPSMDKFSFSPSALETYIECPCKFLLQYIEGYGKVKLATYSNNWFVGGEFGTFCHLVLQKYFTINYKPSQKKAFHQAIFNKCFEEAKKETLNIIPYGNKNAIESDLSRAKYLLKEYIDHEVMMNDDYFTLSCEYKFDKEDAGEIFEIDGNNIIVSYYGTIDRIDIKLKEDGQLSIRAIDYKTTSKNKIVSKVNAGHAFQSHIYAIAAKSYIFKNKSKIEKLLNKKLSFEKLDDIPSIEFLYVVLSNNDYEEIDVLPKHDALAIDNLRAIVKSILAYNERHNLDEVLTLMNKTLAKESEQHKSDCQYCPFIRHCRYKINSGENMFPKAMPKEKGERNE